MRVVRIEKASKPRLQVMLVRADQESNDESPDDVASLMATHRYETRVARRNPVTVAEWAVCVTGTTSLVVGVANALVTWRNGTNGRKLRVKHGDREFEANSLDDIKKLIKLAGDELDLRVIQPSAPARVRHCASRFFR